MVTNQTSSSTSVAVRAIGVPTYTVSGAVLPPIQFQKPVSITRRVSSFGGASGIGISRPEKIIKPINPTTKLAREKGFMTATKDGKIYLTGSKGIAYAKANDLPYRTMGGEIQKIVNGDKFILRSGAFTPETTFRIPNTILNQAKQTDPKLQVLRDKDGTQFIHTTNKNLAERLVDQGIKTRLDRGFKAETFAPAFIGKTVDEGTIELIKQSLSSSGYIFNQNTVIEIKKQLDRGIKEPSFTIIEKNGKKIAYSDKEAKIETTKLQKIEEEQLKLTPSGRAKKVVKERPLGSAVVSVVTSPSVILKTFTVPIGGMIRGKDPEVVRQSLIKLQKDQIEKLIIRKEEKSTGIFLAETAFKSLPGELATFVGSGAIIGKVIKGVASTKTAVKIATAFPKATKVAVVGTEVALVGAVGIGEIIKVTELSKAGLTAEEITGEVLTDVGRLAAMGIGARSVIKPPKLKKPVVKKFKKPTVIQKKITKIKRVTREKLIGKERIVKDSSGKTIGKITTKTRADYTISKKTGKLEFIEKTKITEVRNLKKGLSEIKKTEVIKIGKDPLKSATVKVNKINTIKKTLKFRINELKTILKSKLSLSKEARLKTKVKIKKLEKLQNEAILESFKSDQLKIDVEKLAKTTSQMKKDPRIGKITFRDDLKLIKVDPVIGNTIEFNSIQRGNAVNKLTNWYNKYKGVSDKKFFGLFKFKTKVTPTSPKTWVEIGGKKFEFKIEKVKPMVKKPVIKKVEPMVKKPVIKKVEPKEPRKFIKSEVISKDGTVQIQKTKIKEKVIFDKLKTKVETFKTTQAAKTLSAKKLKVGALTPTLTAQIALSKVLSKQAVLQQLKKDTALKTDTLLVSVLDSAKVTESMLATTQVTKLIVPTAVVAGVTLLSSSLAKPTIAGISPSSGFIPKKVKGIRKGVVSTPKFKPSLTALEFNITARKTPSIVTGVGIRPIIVGNKKADKKLKRLLKFKIKKKKVKKKRSKKAKKRTKKKKKRRN